MGLRPQRCDRRSVNSTVAMSLMFPQYNEGPSSYESMGADQMNGLMELLGVSKQEEQDEQNRPPSLNPKTGGQGSQAPPNMRVAVRKPKKKDEKAIWQPEEFKAASGVVVKQEECDDRETPKYEIMPRQRMGATDAYLNMEDMDPSSDRCQELLIKIWLPETQLKDISVDVMEDRILLQAPRHRLNLALPHKVKKDSGNAKWDKVAGLLSVVVPIDAKIKYYTNPEEAFAA